MFAVSEINTELMPKGHLQAGEKNTGNSHRKNTGKGCRQCIGEIQIARQLRKRHFTSNQRNANSNYNAIHFKITRLSKTKNLINIKC